MTAELATLGSRDILGKTVTAYGTVENPLFDPAIVAEAIDYSMDGNGYYNISQMLESVDDDEKVLVEAPTVDWVDCTQSKKQGNLRTKRWFLKEFGVYETLMLSRKPRAKEFKAGVKNLLRDIRTGKSQFAMSQQLESLQTRLQLAEQKLQLFEEYSENQRCQAIQAILPRQSLQYRNDRQYGTATDNADA